MINLKVVFRQKVIFEKEVEVGVYAGAEGVFAGLAHLSLFIS
jgi:hypothetical protein